MNVKLFPLLLFVLFFSCVNEPSFEGEFSFTNVSENNEVFGYGYENGVEIELEQSDIPLELFEEISSVAYVDDINIIDGETLEYTSYNVYSEGNRKENSSYTLENDILTFEHIDEFGNADPIGLVVEGDQLVLQMYAYRYNWGGSNFQAMEKYYSNPNFVISGEQALSRLEDEEGSLSYIMLYKQYYTK